MSFLLGSRFRRLRANATTRGLLRETQLHMSDMIYPIFVQESIEQPVAISSMPGIFRYPEAQLGDVVKDAWKKGIRAVLLFGVSENKDADGSDTWNEQGLMARIIRIAKQAQPEMLVISDNCFCEYTDHGHCGVVCNDDVDNDATLVNWQKQSIVTGNGGDHRAFLQLNQGGIGIHIIITDHSANAVVSFLTQASSQEHQHRRQG